MATDRIMTTPNATGCQKNSIRKVTSALIIIDTSKTPANDPIIEARPPKRDVPPTTTAAMTCRLQ